MEVKNPLFRADMPDPDIIRVGSTYYMVSTTMFYMPGAPILKSTDLCNWEIISYVCGTVADNDIYELKNGKNAYGKGQWATSLMHYKDKFYVCFVCHDMKQTYLYQTDDIEKSGWDRVVLQDVYHDMTFLYWEDRIYLVYGNGEIRIVELNEDLTASVPGSDRLLFETQKEGMRLRCEGCRGYALEGYIYLVFIDWPADTEDGPGRRRVICYRSRNLEGPYELKVLLDDDLWLPGRGIAQGPLIDSEDGSWYAMMFQDSGAIGRVPFLMPVRWEDGWPILGIDGKVPGSFHTPFIEDKRKPIVDSDSFDHRENKLKTVWQWNHNPNPAGWSFTERPGYLRLKALQPATSILDARNTLTQRTIWPDCSFTVTLDTKGMKDGDYAGLCVLEEKYGLIGVRMEDGRARIVTHQRDGERPTFAMMTNPVNQDEWYELIDSAVPAEQDVVYLKIFFDFKRGRDEAEFFYSMDGNNWQKLGSTLQMFYSLTIFVGSRIGIFCYSGKETGGYADFKDFCFVS